MVNKVEPITQLEKRYPEEWLLVEVTKEDTSGNPIEGKLITHNKTKEKIIEKSKNLGRDIALFYSGEIPKKGYAFCF